MHNVRVCAGVINKYMKLLRFLVHDADSILHIEQHCETSAWKIFVTDTREENSVHSLQLFFFSVWTASPADKLFELLTAAGRDVAYKG